jgi:acetyl esterase/lipase
LALPWPAAKAQPEGAPAAVPQKSPTAAVTPPPTFADVRYGPDRRNVLDFWKADTGKPAPVLIYIHGGGFVHGDKSLIPGVDIEFYRRAGISVASIDYRYSTQAPYPAPMLDSARAVQFIRSKAAEWNLDPKRVGAYGNSAGAGIALWLAFHADLAKPDSADPISRQSTRLSALVRRLGNRATTPSRFANGSAGGLGRPPCSSNSTASSPPPTLKNPRISRSSRMPPRSRTSPGTPRRS